MTRPAYIPLARQIVDSEVWEMGPLAIQLWLWMLMQAVYMPDGVTIHNGKTKVERGQLWTTLERIQNACKSKRGRGFTVPPQRTIQRLISGFKVASMVDTMVVRKGMMITVCNYDSYNHLESSTSVNSGVVSGTKERTYKKKEKKNVSTDSSEEKVFPEWTRTLLDEWEDAHDLPSRVNITACLDTFDKLHRIDKYPVEVIQQVVRKLLQNSVPKYIRSPTKLREPNKAGDEQTFEMYRRMQKADAEPQTETTYTKSDTESWKKDLKS